MAEELVLSRRTRGTGVKGRLSDGFSRCRAARKTGGRTMKRFACILALSLLLLTLAACRGAQTPDAPDAVSAAVSQETSAGPGKAPEDSQSASGSTAAPAGETPDASGAAPEETPGGSSGESEELVPGGTFVPAGEEAEGVLPEWGVTLRVTSASATGLAYVWEQAGGLPEGELSTGTWYEVLRLEGGEWVPQPYLPDNVGWETVALLLPEGGSLDGETDWEWLYGSLPAGEYRFVKEVMLFRGTGDYDTQKLSASFSIE